VLERDRVCQAKSLVAMPCYGPLTYHHLTKASHGGAYSEANGLALCARHNTWVEDHPVEARAIGLA
jgi:hypothetical protein